MSVNWQVLPTFPAVYHLLGPAMPGVYKQESQMYWLAYPGVTFMFPISPEFAHMFKDERDLTMVLPDRSSPVAGLPNASIYTNTHTHTHTHTSIYRYRHIHIYQNISICIYYLSIYLSAYVHT